MREVESTHQSVPPQMRTAVQRCLVSCRVVFPSPTYLYPIVVHFENRSCHRRGLFWTLSSYLRPFEVEQWHTTTGSADRQHCNMEVMDQVTDDERIRRLAASTRIFGDIQARSNAHQITHSAKRYPLDYMLRLASSQHNPQTLTVRSYIQHE